MNKDIKMDKILRYVCIGLGVLLIVAIFIPYIQLTGTAAKYSVDITLSNGKVLDGEAMKHLSIFDYIQVFIAGKDDLEQIGESYGTAYWAVYLVLYIASAAAFALTGLLSILGKRVGSIVFSIISILLNRVIYWDFKDRGIVGDYSRRVFGFAPPTIRLWVTEDLATSQDLLPFHCLSCRMVWHGSDGLLLGPDQESASVDKPVSQPSSFSAVRFMQVEPMSVSFIAFV